MTFSVSFSDKAEQILQGALPEFLKNGYACTSMDKVAQAAGVSKQTLYSHFTDKEGLFTALVQRMASEKFRLVWSKPLQGDPKMVLTELAQRILKEVDDPEHLSFVRLIITESSKRPDLAQLFLKNVAQPALAILTRYLSEHPELRIENEEATARIFVGTLLHHVLTQKMLQGEDLMPINEHCLIETLVNLIVKS